MEIDFKRCGTCRLSLPTTSFVIKNDKHKPRISSTCRQCDNERVVHYRNKRMEEVKLSNKSKPTSGPLPVGACTVSTKFT